MPDVAESSINIAASPAAIMAVIADLPRYPEWSDGVRSVDVLRTYEDGRPESARFVFDAGLIRDTYILEYTWNDHRQVSWWLHDGKVLKAMDGIYRLDVIGDHTRVDYQLKVELAIPMISALRRRAEKAIIDTALKGLKTRVEGTHGQ